ncbi:MAG TPA: flavodoxin domain-containing protein, partial [Gaiellaceae bacterium]
FDGVVLGGALYAGRLQRDARRFLRRHRKELATLAVAVFALGPRRDTKEHLQRSRQQLERALAKVPEVKPVLTGCFGGADREKQVDLRDWGVIRAWAEDAADAFDAASATRVEVSTDS